MKFETGKTYETRSLCDYDCIFKMTVLKRTEKTLTVKIAARALPVVCRIKTVGNYESVKPLGSYSMAPEFIA